jgi:2-(1,2-epoxy-1,2-dihydrophenyl)acetyl-CoA isomerase
MTSGAVVTVARLGAVAEVTMNRPEALNALSRPLIEALRSTLAELAADLSVRAVILTGAGRGFCAGADLTPNSGFGGGLTVSGGEATAQRMASHFNPLALEAATFPKPMVAAVNGVAAGGGVALALAADIVLAARSASFVQVFGPRLGLVPDMGCTWLVPHALGRARARGLALLGDRLSAEKAAEWGLVWEAVDDAALMTKARAIAARLAAGPSNAFKNIKLALDAAPFNDLATQLELERSMQRELADGEDLREGVRAFLEKREPRFHAADNRS